MVYRPSINSDLAERVDLYTAGEQMNRNEIVEQSIDLMLDEQGNKRELPELLTDKQGKKRDWLRTMENYCEREDLEVHEVLEHIVKEIMTNEGRVKQRHRENLKFTYLEADN